MVNQNDGGGSTKKPSPKKKTTNSQLSPEMVAKLLNLSQGSTDDSPMKNWSGLPRTAPMWGPEPKSKAQIGENPLAPVASSKRDIPLSPSDLLSPTQSIAFEPMKLPSFDPTKYKAQATSLVNQQYNPIIQELIRQQGTTKNRAAANKREVGDIYTDLARYTVGQQRDNYAGYQNAEAATKAAYTDQRDQVAAMYAQASKEQQDMARQLGTANLGVSDGIAQQNQDQVFAQQTANQQATSEQAAFDLMQQSQLGYDRAATAGALAEGKSRQLDIGAQLEDYLAKSGMQIADTRSTAAGAGTDLMMKLAEAAYGRDTANAQFQYQQQQAQQEQLYRQQRDMIGDQNQLFQFGQQNEMNQLDKALKLQQLQRGLQPEGTDPADMSPWQKVANFAGQIQPQQAPDLISALQQAMQNNPQIYAPDPEGVRMNPSLFAKLVLDSPGGENVDQNSLAMIAQELYRQLYGTG